VPYYITEDSSDCDGWAVVKENGDVMGCHDSKAGAIAQAVAISESEGSTFEGERALRALPDNYRPAVSADVPEGRACGNCVFYNEEMINDDGVRVWCERWDDWVRGDHYCNAWQGEESRPYHDDEDEDRQESEPAPESDLSEGESREVSLNLPQSMRAAARQGLEFHREGKSGDGVVPRTIREASAMAAGNITADKVVRANAWAARHKVDLEAAGAKPGQDGYPTPGAVAHLLWGIPTGAGYDAAVGWFSRKAEQIKDDRSDGMTVTPVRARTPNSGIEFRSTTVELRQEGDGNTFVGYAAMFNSPSQPLPFVERIAPGAFAKSLANRRRDVRLYVNHNSDLVLASKRSSTLMLSEDEKGLRVEAMMPDTTYARDLSALMAAGVVDKMSFGFSVPRGGDKWSGDGNERELREVVLHEVSVVTGFPAYEQTQAAVRSLERLSERTGMDVHDLTTALDALADGEPLDQASVDLLMAAIVESSPKQDVTPNLIGIKQKQHELFAKKAW